MEQYNTFVSITMSRKKRPLDTKETERYKAIEMYNQFLPIKISINKGMEITERTPCVHNDSLSLSDSISLSRANILTTEYKLYMA